MEKQLNHIKKWKKNLDYIELKKKGITEKETIRKIRFRAFKPDAATQGITAFQRALSNLSLSHKQDSHFPTLRISNDDILL